MREQQGGVAGPLVAWGGQFVPHFASSQNHRIIHSCCLTIEPLACGKRANVRMLHGNVHDRSIVFKRTQQLANPAPTVIKAVASKNGYSATPCCGYRRQRLIPPKPTNAMQILTIAFLAVLAVIHALPVSISDSSFASSTKSNAKVPAVRLTSERKLQQMSAVASPEGPSQQCRDDVRFATRPMLQS